MSAPQSIRVTLVLGIAVAGSGPVSLSAQETPGSVVSQVGFDQNLGARLPLELPFQNDSGPEVTLGGLCGTRPLILVPVYFRCPMLCNQVLSGLTRSLRPLSISAGKQFDVVAVSIDPQETPALAAKKKAAYLERYDRPGSESGWHFLTG